MNEWSAWLQRRLMRLLLRYDQGLFRGKFSTFFTESSLPQIPLLQQYDRYIKLVTLSDELLDDILPRIRRQLSLQTDHARLLEEAPTRGDIDWSRTIGRTLRETPGLAPMRFDTRLRQRSTTTPENLFTVAVLLAYRQEIQSVQQQQMEDERLGVEELQVLIGANERAERELAAPYARDLIEQASQSEVESLVAQVMARLHPGASPYRDLIEWWWRFQELHIGREKGKTQLALASQRDDEKVDAWLYELWIAMEIVHCLAEQKAVVPGDTDVQNERLQLLFTWQGRRFRFRYNRQREESVGESSGWEESPGSRPDYSIERASPLKVEQNGQVIWQEPPVVMDAKYYLSGSDPTRTHGPIKKMLGEMTMLDAELGMLFFPLLPEPSEQNHPTRSVKRKQERHQAGRAIATEIALYHIVPESPLEKVQQRLVAILDRAVEHLPERAEPRCEGIWLDPDSRNASESARNETPILCPKRHIGERVFDLVNPDTQCLKDPRVCHIIGQKIARPEVIRVTSREALEQMSQGIRGRNDEQLRQAEQTGQEEQAEQLRKQILERVGGAVEQYVKLRGDTRPIEDTFRNWIFRGYWEGSGQALAIQTRNMLLSGEYVWHEYADTTLDDWAAPAIQYCRALEYEVRRRIYLHRPTPTRHQAADSQAFRMSGAGWTLGTLKHLHRTQGAARGDDRHNWGILEQILAQAHCGREEFLRLLQRIKDEDIVEYRNHLAHGEPISKQVAENVRTSVLGTSETTGLLGWLVRKLPPAEMS